MVLLVLAFACDSPPKPYGLENRLEVPGTQRLVWAVAPTINLSGHSEVDAILQSDLLYQQLQEVGGMTVVPVDRVVQTFASLQIDKVNTPQQASLVCDLLQVDGLVVPTITSFDPYAPPKMGASLALFRKPAGYVRDLRVELPDLARRVNPADAADFRQAVGMFDSADGTVRKSLLEFAAGRSDPNGPMAEREYFLSMDRYCGFVYHQLIADLLGVPSQPPPADGKTASANAN